MKLKKLLKLSLIIFALFLSYTNSQLEFLIRRVPARETMKLLLANFLATVQRETPVRTEGPSLLQMTKTSDNLLTIRIALGTPSQEFEVILDTGSFFLWVPSSECTDCQELKNKFNVYQSDSLVKFYKKLKYKFISGVISGEICHERFNIGSFSLPQLKFLLIDHIDFNIGDADGILGLGRIYEGRFDGGYSIIDSLFRADRIKKRMFSVIIEDNMVNSKLTIGTIPKEIQEDLGNFTKCKVVTEDANVNKYWTCNLKQVLFIQEPKKNIFYLFNKTAKAKVTNILKSPRPVIFDTGTNFIFAPNEYYEIFQKVFFRDMLERKLCWSVDEEAFHVFKCNKGYTYSNAFPKLRFVLDNDFSYEFNVKDFFYETNGVYEFRIMFGNMIKGDPWLLGLPFLQRFHVVYDHDDLTVGLYPKKNGTIVANSIVSLNEFEEEIPDGEDGNNILFYFGIFFICGFMLSLIAVLFLKIFKIIFCGKNKVGELEQERMINLVTAEGENKTL